MLLHKLTAMWDTLAAFTTIWFVNENDSRKNEDYVQHNGQGLQNKNTFTQKPENLERKHLRKSNNFCEVH
jgi:hypothetical protein